MWKSQLEDVWRRIGEGARAYPRVAIGIGTSGFAAGAALVVLAVGSDGPPKVHFPQRPKLEPLIFSYPPNTMPEGAPRAVVPETPKMFSGVQSAGLELVRSESGRLSSIFVHKGICAKKPCDALIVTRADGAVVFDGARWAEGYIPTGRGEEVVRVRRDSKD